jgi:haloalkane dehalogenase
MVDTNELKSHYMEVDGDLMHYLTCSGEGKSLSDAKHQDSTMVFLHGMPTSSHTWRHIMPACADVAHCIAPDLIGMGRSSKPSIPYRVVDHLFYLETFLNQLGRDKITLVMHGWGSVLGFDYAMRYPERIEGLVFYEAHVRPVLDWGTLSLPVQQLLSMIQSGEITRDAVMHENVFMDMLLPMATMGKLDESSLDYYHSVFATPESRLPLWQYLQDLPIVGWADDVVGMISEYASWLQATDIPKLMIYSLPGFMTTMDTVAWCQLHLPHLQVLEVGEAMHFAQETKPVAFREGLLSWYVAHVGDALSVV